MVLTYYNEKDITEDSLAKETLRYPKTTAVEIVNVFKTEEVFNQTTPFSISPDNYLYVILEDDDYSFDSGTVIDSEVFLEAYKKDLLARS